MANTQPSSPASASTGTAEVASQNSVPAISPSTVPTMRSSDFCAVSPELFAVTISAVSASQ